MWFHPGRWQLYIPPKIIAVYDLRIAQNTISMQLSYRQHVWKEPNVIFKDQFDFRDKISGGLSAFFSLNDLVPVLAQKIKNKWALRQFILQVAHLTTVDVQILNLKALAALEDIAVFGFTRLWNVNFIWRIVESLVILGSNKSVPTGSYFWNVRNHIFDIDPVWNHIINETSTLRSSLMKRSSSFSANFTHVRLTKITFELVGFMFSFVFGYH